MVKKDKDIFKSLFESAPDAVVLVNQQTNICLINQQTEKMFGYSNAELLDKPIEILIPNRSHKRHIKNFSDYYQNPAARPMGSGIELSGVKKDGSEFPVEISLSPLEQESKLFISAAIRDITEKRQKETEISKSRERYLSIFNESLDGIVLIDSKTGAIADCNPEFERLSGHNKTILKTKKIWELRPPGKIEEAKEMFFAIKAKGTGGSGELEFQKPTGEIVLVEFISKLTELNEKHYIQSMVRDISARKLTETKLQQRISELSIIHRLGNRISSSLFLDQIVQSSISEVANSTHSDVAVVYFRKNGMLHLGGMYPESSEQIYADAKVKCVGQCLCGLAVEQEAPLYSSDIHKDPRCTLSECKNAGIRSFAALPLIIGKNNLGVLGLSSFSKRNFQEQASFLETLAAQIAASLQNARLHDQVKQQANDLEKKVLKRTEELNKINHQLLQEMHERKLAEEERIRFFTMSLDMLCISNFDGYFIQLNPAWEETLGWSLDELKAKPYIQFVHSEDREPTIQEAQKLALGDNIISFENR